MSSKWISVSALAIAIICIGGSCREIQQETAVSAPGPDLGSTSPVAETGPASVAGSWSLVLMEAASGWTRPANLEIVQIDDVIFGRGSSEDGGAGVVYDETDSRPTEDQGIESMVWWLHQDPEPEAPTTTVRGLTIGASGRVSGTSLSLDLIFLEENVLYRLELNAVGSSISGSYQAYDSLGRVRSGSCYGYIRAGRGQSALPLGSRPEVLSLGGMTSR
jgi:hypothetical protein